MDPDLFTPEGGGAVRPGYTYAPDAGYLGTDAQGYAPALSNDRYTGENPAVEEALKRKRADDLAKEQERAIREAGYQEYNQLVAGGAKPEEALRRTAGKLYYNEPSRLVSALKTTSGLLPPPLPATMPSVPLLGADGKPIAYGTFDPNSHKLHSVIRPTSPRMPDEMRLGLQDSRDEMGDIRRRISQQEKALNDAVTDKEKQAIGSALLDLRKTYDEAKKSRQSLYKPKAEKAPVDSTEKVVVMKDGKRFRLPKSQLKDAQSQGYSLVE